MLTRAKTRYLPLPRNLSYISKIVIKEPNIIVEALNNLVRYKGMKTTYQALMRNQTWELVVPNSDQNLVGHKWVYKVKLNVDGIVQKLKAGLITKGFQQTPKVDYFDTFSPMVKIITIRIVPTLTFSYDWLVYQIDINNVFLNKELQEEVYMSQP